MRKAEGATKILADGLIEKAQYSKGEEYWLYGINVSEVYEKLW